VGWRCAGEAAQRYGELLYSVAGAGTPTFSRRAALRGSCRCSGLRACGHNARVRDVRRWSARLIAVDFDYDNDNDNDNYNDEGRR